MMASILRILSSYYGTIPYACTTASVNEYLKKVKINTAINQLSDSTKTNRP